MAGRRADAVHVGRQAGSVGRQRTAPLGHHAEAAEDEHFHLDGNLGAESGDFRHRQDTRQHGPLDAEGFMIEADRFRRRSRSLHRQMQPQLGMLAAGIIAEAHIGQDHRIGLQFGGVVHRLMPDLGRACAGEGVDGHQHLGATLMGIGDAVGQFRTAEIQAGEVAGVGLVAEADIDAVGPGIDGGLQGSRGAGGADQLDIFSTHQRFSR